jgi:hypothetical protein
MIAPRWHARGPNARWLLFLTIPVSLLAPFPGSADKGAPLPRSILVTDGSTVHDIGEVHLHMGNWGLIGSQPGASTPYSDAPSAEWPAGSGVEYLFGAGLWVGGLVGGAPSTATAFPGFEFRPADDPRDVMYRSREGARGGRRAPHPLADDDRDGRVDEDRLNGYDNDGDGRVDEDFAAIADQMLACEYADDVVAVPNHTPLHLAVHQESYAWRHPRYDDFVAIRYRITNTGTEAITDMHAGVFVDPDIGRRNVAGYYNDDAFGSTPDGDGATRLVYAFDADGDGGMTPGYLGLMVLHAGGATGPAIDQFHTVVSFDPGASFEDGGFPTNDFERYEVLASGTVERPKAGFDINFLASTGPFERLEPGNTLELVVAVVMGNGREGVLSNAANVRALFASGWHIPTALAGSTPARIQLGENTPNPFNPATRVPFSLPADAHVRVTVYDVTGKRVDTLVDGWRAAGTHDVTWNAAGVASGVYFCRLDALGQTETRRLIVLK